jgi:hypothetical protein
MIKELLRGRHFDDIRSNETAALKASPTIVLRGELGNGIASQW